MQRIGAHIDALRNSFTLGNAIKEGVAVAITGALNVGKSTLLNRLLNEERVLVSDIAGTTRDVIEERINIDGVAFGSSTRRASAQRTTGWNRWASSARCRASSGRRS